MDIEKLIEQLRYLADTPVALHEVYGFGPERISRFRDGMEAVIMEYGGLMDETDADYADGKLAQRYEAIVGVDAYPERK